MPEKTPIHNLPTTPRSPYSHSVRFFPKLQELELNRKRTHYGPLYVSPDFKQFLGRNKGVLTPVFKRIIESYAHLSEGKRVVMPPSPTLPEAVVIEKRHTGSYAGVPLGLNLRISFGAKRFFARLRPMDPYFEKRVEAVKVMYNYLRSINNRVGSFHIKVIPPHLAAQYKKGSIWVTDFFYPNEVASVGELHHDLHESIENAVVWVARDVKYLGIREIDPVNTFYHKKTSTILLFDMIKE